MGDAETSSLPRSPGHCRHPPDYTVIFPFWKENTVHIDPLLEEKIDTKGK